MTRSYLADVDEIDPDLSQRVILVMDDEVLIGMDICESLEEAGASALYARTVDAAMRFLDTAAIDGAILDVNLGHDTDCLPVARRLQEAGVPFILYSGDLDRRGEFVRRIGAPLVRKPGAMSVVLRNLGDVIASA